MLCATYIVLVLTIFCGGAARDLLCLVEGHGHDATAAAAAVRGLREVKTENVV